MRCYLTLHTGDAAGERHHGGVVEKESSLKKKLLLVSRIGNKKTKEKIRKERTISGNISKGNKTSSVAEANRRSAKCRNETPARKI